jgi:hypothetical protein
MAGGKQRDLGTARRDSAFAVGDVGGGTAAGGVDTPSSRAIWTDQRDITQPHDAQRETERVRETPSYLPLPPPL